MFAQEATSRARIFLAAATTFWHGSNDELALFNHALDATTINALYESGERPGPVVSIRQQPD